MKILKKMATVGAVAMLGIGLGTGAATAVPVGSSGPNALLHDSDEAFFQTPDHIPSTPGTIIRSAPLPHAPDGLSPLLDQIGGDLDARPLEANRILYSSTAPDGSPMVVSGIVIEPAVEWKGKGETPIIVMSPGTRGVGMACAATAGPGMVGVFSPENGNLNANYELPLFYTVPAQGMRLVVPDFAGLGTEGNHQYLELHSEGTAVVDAARAALNFSNASPDSPVGFFGYSQGGGAAAAGAEYAKTYAPELNLKGTYAGAPVMNLEATAHQFNQTSLAGLQVFIVSGMKTADPAAYEEMMAHLNDEGKRIVREAAYDCAANTIPYAGFRDSRKWTTTGESIAELMRRLPAVKAYNDRQLRGHAELNAPILIINDDADDIVPEHAARTAARDYCAAGNTVEYRAGGAPSILPGTGINHGIAMYSRVPEAMSWMIDRFNDVPTSGNCGTF